MTGKLEMFINGKRELRKDVVSFKYVEDLIRNWKAKMIPALSNSDSWEIVLTIKTDLVKRQNK